MCSRADDPTQHGGWDGVERRRIAWDKSTWYVNATDPQQIAWIMDHSAHDVETMIANLEGIVDGERRETVVLALARLRQALDG